MRLCACGCQRPLKREWRTKGQPARYATPACIPHTVRVMGARKGRRTYAYRKRDERFRAALAQIEGRRITREQLYDVLADVYRVGYVSGYRAGKYRAQPALMDVAQSDGRSHRLQSQANPKDRTLGSSLVATRKGQAA